MVLNPLDYTARANARAREGERKDREDRVDEELTTDPEATQTPNGKNLKRPRRPRTSEPDRQKNLLTSFFRKAVEEAVTLLASFVPLMKGGDLNPLSREHLKAANQKTSYLFEDNANIYDTQATSLAAATLLNEEFDVINSYLDEISNTADSVTKERLRMEMTDLAGYFDMVEHPVTKRYVHNLDRVIALELELNGKKSYTLLGEVYVYYPKATHGDSRVVKRALGDVCHADSLADGVLGNDGPQAHCN